MFFYSTNIWPLQFDCNLTDTCQGSWLVKVSCFFALLLNVVGENNFDSCFCSFFLIFGLISGVHANLTIFLILQSLFIIYHYYFFIYSW